MGLIAGIIWDWVEWGFKHLLEHEFVHLLVKQLFGLLGTIGVWLVLALAVIVFVSIAWWLVAVLISALGSREPYAAKDLAQPESRQDVWGAVFWALAILAILLFLGW